MRSGVTLIETLAVVVLIALATAVLTRGMTASSPERDAARALAVLSEFDVSARAMAVASGPLRVQADGNRLTALSAEGETLIERGLPVGWTVELTSWHQHGWVYVIDGAGRSEDVNVLLTGPTARHGISLNGLLGTMDAEGIP